MAIRIKTDDPMVLLHSIKAKIRDGSITLWVCDRDGDFTLAAPKYANQSWLRPLAEGNVLRLNIIAPEETDISKDLYAVYHARFVQMLLEEFDDIFESVNASALPEIGDSI